MFADQPMLNDAITALLVYIQIGSLVWAYFCSRGSLRRVYAGLRVDAYEVDPCQRFIDTHVIPCGPGVSSRAMFEAFETWCKANGVRSLPARRFAFAMAERGFESSAGRGLRVYHTVGLCGEPESKPARLDRVRSFVRSALITLLLIIGWPAMLIARCKGDLR